MEYEAWGGGGGMYQVKFVPGLSTFVRTHRYHCCWVFFLKIFGLGVIDCIQLTSYSFLINNGLQVIC